MLIAGIIVLVAKDKKGMLITATVFWSLGGLLLAGAYSDLIIWSSLNLLFAVLCVLFVIRKLQTPQKPVPVMK